MRRQVSLICAFAAIATLSSSCMPLPNPFAVWDLSKPTTAEHFRGEFDDLVTAETLGRDGVSVHLTLPGGDVVAGDFGVAIASEDETGALTSVSLNTTNYDDPAQWESRVDAFTSRWPTDTDAIDAYLEELSTRPPTDVVDLGRYFEGETDGGYTVTLAIRPGGAEELRVVVTYLFTMSYFD